VYVNITAKCEKEKFAPAGKENWFVMINAPANNGEHRDTINAIARKNILDKLSRMLKINLESFIETEEITDPTSIEEQSLCYRGSLYGSASNTALAAFFAAS